MSLVVEVTGDVAVLTIDRPEAENRLDAASLDQLAETMQRLAADQDGPSVVVMRANGPDFSLGRQYSSRPPRTPVAITQEFSRIQRVNELIQHSPLVTIAAIRGRAHGAGLSLAGRCDIVIVADDASLAFPEIPHGIPPTIVLSHYRYVLPRNLLGDLIFTGRELTGVESVAAGLAARAVPSDEVEGTALALATRVSGYDRRSRKLVKDFLNRTESLPPRDAPALGIALYALEVADRNLASD